VAVADRIHRAAVRARLSDGAWMEKHFDRYFHLIDTDLGTIE
jgi:hypothetical protein